MHKIAKYQNRKLNDIKYESSVSEASLVRHVFIPRKKRV